MTNRMKAILGASATIAVWATAFPFGKLALQSVDALTLSVARVVGGAILMLIIGVFKGLHIPDILARVGHIYFIRCYRELPLSSRF